MNNFLKLKISFLLAALLLIENFSFAQRSSVSIPIGVARTACSGGSSTLAYYNYDENANTLSTAITPLSCVPALQIGAVAPTFNYTANLSSVSYNPADTSIYYLWSDLFGTYGPIKTYIWKWPVGTCPTSTSPRLDTIRSFPFDILGATFDNNGVGYLLEFEGSESPYKAFLRTINFAAGSVGPKDTLALTNSKILHTTGTGDIAISPSGKMFFACNNKLFGIDYSNYGSAAKKLTAQYIDTLTVNPSAPDLIALTYAQGELISGYGGGTQCVNYEINPSVQNDIPINSISTNRTVDGASLVNSIGVAKQLVSAVMVTTSTYDLTYRVLIKNMGTFPLSTVQAFDTLTKINPSGVVSNITTAFITNPGGVFALNTSYNGSTNTNLLTSSAAVLQNFPTSINTIVIEVKCRITGLVPGIEYRNRAYATAIGFRNQPLRDTSTTGIEPDLNGNGVADNLGESRPTVFFIPLTPTAGVCGSFANTFYSQNFGTVSGMSSVIPNESTKSFSPLTAYTGASAAPMLSNTYTITNNSSLGNPTIWVSGGDNTGGANGAMLVANADALANIIYKDTVGLCGGHEYSVSFYGKDITTAAQKAVCNATTGYNAPRLKLRVFDPVNNILVGEVVTPFLGANWQQYGFRWIMPNSINQVYFEILNDGNGGCGGDLAIDDILIATCSAAPTISVVSSSICTGGSLSFTANLTNSSVVPGRKTYQLEVSPDGVSGWTIATTSQSTTYTISPTTPADLNKYYRYAVADSASGNIDVASCRFVSPVTFVAGKNISILADFLGKGKNNNCPGEPIMLVAIGGDSGTNGTWRWFTGSCGGTLVGTGRTITVSPTVATTYFLRAVGDCNTTACLSIPVTFNCDIDDDNDGIPDLVEQGGVDIDLDDNFDGIPNYLDETTVGFVDTNNDNIDDRYDNDRDGLCNQFDRDSDNDGIPDVIESFGVDTNGDGIIDNYTDTDADGFSQNVDANNTGWLTSGRGLNDLDLDQDGYPNFLDTDSDGDGIPDIVEAGGSDGGNFGYINGGFNDSSPLDGINDSWDLTACIMLTGTDTNGDGRADSYPNDNKDGDRRPNPYDLDSDGDGLTDVIEQMYARWVAFGGAGSSARTIWDGNLDGRADGAINSRGYTTAIFNLSTLPLYNSDGDSYPYPDFLDIDSDNDGITDNIEGQTTFTSGANYKLPTGTDSDNDGLDDEYELSGDIGTHRGGRINPLNIDGDLRADYLDTDSDGDGTLDVREGNDWDLQGDADEVITLLNADTDGDGLDNRFDTTTTGYRVTSRLLGNLGVFAGSPPLSYGTKAVMTRTAAGQYDRNWRYMLGLLAINDLQLSGVLNGTNSALNWSYTKKSGLVTVYLQHSLDGLNFSTLSTNVIPILDPGERQENYSHSIANISAPFIYYKVKIVTADGETNYSNTVSVKNPFAKTQNIVLSPNPANDYFKAQIVANKKTVSALTVRNAQGQTMLQRTENLQEGVNNLHVDCSKWNSGVYVLSININGEIKMQKIIVN